MTTFGNNNPIFPAGHFYSPIVDTTGLALQSARVWRDRSAVAGIDLNAESHIEILADWFPRYIHDYDYPDSGDTQEPASFFNLNDQFSWLDARLLYVFLRHLQPRRLVEVGSGFSSLLAADVNVRFLGNRMDFTCIEPYPRAFLKSGIPGIGNLIEKCVQDVTPDYFEELGSGDILFIDSSHVAKTGSDVTYLFLEVLPRLKAGVLVHVHDIFIPAEYPRNWVLDENRSWNEQYLLQALLMFSTRFGVVFGSAYAAHVHGEAVVKALARPDGHGMSGGSFWITVRA